MARLGDVCSYITDGSHNPPQGLENSDYYMLSSKNIDDDRITLESPRYLSSVDFESENKRTQVTSGDLLMTIVGTIGKVAIVSEDMPPFCVQRSVAVIKSKHNIIYNRFLMYQLQSMRSYLEKESRGVAQKGIYLKQLINLSISVPPMTEQKYIANVLDRVSSLISLRKHQLDNLDELVKARFVEMFGDPVTNTFRWNKQALGMLCDVRDGTHDSPEYFETGYPLVTSKNVTGGKIDLTSCNLISEAAYIQINERSKVDYGDIIMPMIGTVGKPIIVDIEPRFAIKNVALIKFPPHCTVQNVYIRALLESDYFDRAVISKVRGGTQKFIALGDIRKLEILVPDNETQQQFATFVEQTDKSRLTIQQGLDKLGMMKKALMQEYFG